MVFTREQESYMQRCLDLAIKGSGQVAPNPMVGAVIVHNNTIIGEGYHRSFGGPHAEVEAINSVSEEDRKLLADSDMYVNLEPCSHIGKTPPCCDLLINHEIKNIFIANADPNPLVQGSGIQKLKDAGCNVQTGLLEKQGFDLNKRFFTFHQKKRPYIILKWAQTQDGYFTKNANEQHWITGDVSRRLVHKWRTEEMAIMVGANTIKVDNSRLTARYWKGKNPVRIVLDENLNLPLELNVFNNEAPTYIFNAQKEQEKGSILYCKVSFDEQLLNTLLDKLYELQVLSIMVEGGAKMLNFFIEKGLWDEARILIGDVYFGEGVLAPKIKGVPGGEAQVGEDSLIVFKNG